VREDCSFAIRHTYLLNAGAVPILEGRNDSHLPEGRLVYERDYVNGSKIPNSPELIACIEHVINDVKLRKRPIT
jgi:hypothetical protein